MCLHRSVDVKCKLCNIRTYRGGHKGAPRLSQGEKNTIVNTNFVCKITKGTKMCNTPIKVKASLMVRFTLRCMYIRISVSFHLSLVLNSFKICTVSTTDV